MLKASLLSALRKATEISINVDPSVIVLIPTDKIKGQGGIVRTIPQTPREPQLFTVSAVGATLSGISGTSGGGVRTEGASSRSWSFDIIGRYDAEMEIGDSWKEGNTNYTIISIKPENGYEKVGVVMASGADPSYGA